MKPMKMFKHRRVIVPVIGMKLTDEVIKREKEAFLDTEGMLEPLDLEVREMLGMA
jgi:hypothetical protein